MSSRMRALALVFAIPAFVVGCPSSTPAPTSGTATSSGTDPTATAPPTEPAPTATPSPTPTPPTPAPTPTPVAGWLGKWNSDSCGARSYRREVDFGANDKVSGRDLISPCPTGSTCVWSGIVDWSGSYTVNGTTLQLDVTIGAGPKGTLTLPTQLTWDASKNAVVESDGKVSCPYTKSS